MNAAGVDRINQRWYGRAGVIRAMARQQGFTDEGERAAYACVAREMRDRPILDLGVGSGRTVPLLRLISEDYVGVDYMAAAVATARACHPQADLREGDARQLTGFASGHWDLVVFSNQGIDSVSHADRQRILQEAWRVLSPGGLFWFSTLNLEGPAARYRPWRPLVHEQPRPRRLGPNEMAQRLRACLRLPGQAWRYWRGTRLAESYGQWAMAPFFAGGWRMLVHYTTLAALMRELADAGFETPPRVFDDASGLRVETSKNLHEVFSFNVLARKPARPAPAT